MNFLKKLGGHKVVEDNNLNGIRQGHMLAQFPFDTVKNTQFGEGLDNGFILSVTNDLKLTLHAGEANVPAYLHYSEEYITFLDSASLDMFTLDVAEGAIPRAIKLMPGDVFTTDNFSGLSYDEMDEDTVYGGSIVEGVITVKTVADTDIILIEKSILPSGKEAVKVFWRGV